MPVRLLIAQTDRAFDAPEGEDLLEILQRNGYPISTSCGGVASCGNCRLQVVEGKLLLSPVAPEEITHLGNVAKVIGTRLACQSRVCAADGELVVSVPDVTDGQERRRRKTERMRLDRRTVDGAATTPGTGARAARGPGAPRGPAASQGAPRATAPHPVIEWRPGRLAPKT